MRLIDADKLMKSLKPNESVWVGLVLSELIDNTTTVKAIPIEWIKEWVERDENYWDYQYLTDVLLKDWEKENARD